MNRKYAPLESHLRASGRTRIPMTFEEIERVIGAQLPASVFRHRALWSNNPANWVMTRAWLAAGYETEKVDMANRRLVFRKPAPNPPRSDTSSGPGTFRGDGAPSADRRGSFASVFGLLEGTVTIAPGTNLTDPVGEDWDAARQRR